MAIGGGERTYDITSKKTNSGIKMKNTIAKLIIKSLFTHILLHLFPCVILARI